MYFVGLVTPGGGGGGGGANDGVCACVPSVSENEVGVASNISAATLRRHTVLTTFYHIQLCSRKRRILVESQLTKKETDHT